MSGCAPYEILHTTRSLRIDGVTNVVLRNVTHLDPTRFRSHVCSLRNEDQLAGAFRERGIDPVFLGHRGPASVPATLRRLVRLVRERGIRLIHAHRTVDLALAGTAARLCGVPLVSTVHWIGPQSYPESIPMWRKRAGATVRSVLDRAFATRVVAVSDAVRQSYAAVPFYPTARTAVVYPGVEVSAPSPLPAETASLKRKLELDGARPVLLNIGRLDEVKGQVHLAPMMRRVRERLPGARLLIVGGGVMRGAIERAIAAAGVGDAVTLLGPRTDVDALIAVSDLLVLSSESEALALPPLEAMRLGKPVVATRAGGMPEIVDHGTTGFIVPRGDAAALADAVVAVFETPGRAAAMGEAGRRRVAEVFDIRRSVAALEEIYLAALDVHR